VILYQLLTGDLPFEDNNVQKLLEKIVLGDFSFKGKKSLSKGAKELIKGILETNTRKRFSIKDIKNDKWFKVDYEDDI
jgi:serine/threonine protein kinase